MHLGGVTANPAAEWTVPPPRNLVHTLGEGVRAENPVTAVDLVFSRTRAGQVRHLAV
jgi:hypothetical protein